jgi:hypothetical protein
MIISAPGCVRRDFISEAVEKAIKLWGLKYPQEVVNFDRQMKETRGAYSQERASKLDGNMALFGEIPQSLNGIMTIAMGSNLWHHDPKTRQAFWSLFKVGKIRPNAQMPKHE